MDDPDDSGTTSCAAGYWGLYADVTESSPDYHDYYGCYECPPGTWADEASDKLWCRACPPGTYGLVGGATSWATSHAWDNSINDPGCLPCMNGTYNDQWGATACDVCPEYTTCGALATARPLDAGLEARRRGRAHRARARGG